ncbi:hypothetical protein D3C86_388470 [compost metagenome]
MVGMTNNLECFVVTRTTKQPIDSRHFDWSAAKWRNLLKQIPPLRSGRREKNTEYKK